MATTAKTKAKIVPATKKVVKVPSSKVTKIAEPVKVLENKIATVPDKKILDTYVNRTVSGRTEFEWYDFALEHSRNILIESPTGAGKSMGLEAYAAKKGMAYYSVPFHIGVESSVLFGKYELKEGNTIWKDGAVTDICRHGGVLVLDEMNAARAGALIEFHPILDKRRILILTGKNSEVIPLHPDTLIVANINPNYEGTHTISHALRNRFSVQLVYGYDPEVEKQLVANSALLAMAEQLRNSNEIKTPVSTNMLVEFEELFSELDLDSAVMSFVNHFDSRREREAVKMICATHYNTIEEEYTSIVDGALDDDEEVEVTVASDTDLSEFGEQNRDWVFGTSK